MKILLLAHNHSKKYNWGHHLYRREFGKYHDVIYYGSGYPGYDPKLRVPDLLQKFGKPDFILTDGLRYTLQFEGLGEVKDVPKVHQIVDYFPPHLSGYRGSWIRQHEFFRKNKFDLFFVRQYRQIEDLKNNGIKTPAFFLPFSVDIDLYQKQKLKKLYDVMTSYTTRNDVYPDRQKLRKALSKLQIKLLTKRIIHQTYIKAINQSRIFVTSNNVFGSLSMKYTEVLSCGTFLLADRPEDFDYLNFKDGEHLVLYSNMKDLSDKVKYFLEHPKEREMIASKGMEFVRKNHSNKTRMEYQIEIIQKELGI